MSYRLALLLLAIVLLGVTSIGGSAGATTQVRSQSDPTAWWWYYGQTPAQVTDLIDDNSARIVDIEVQDVSPLRFAVAMVRNEGAYASGWWWYYGLTAQQVSDNLSDNSARLIDLEPYQTGAGLRFAALMVPNTGDQGKAWWWYFGVDPAFIADALSDNNARLVDFDTYLAGAQKVYTAVMISNTGDDAKGWWWYFGVDTTFIANALSDNNARLIDIDVQSAAEGTFNVVMEACPCPFWWWYYGVTEAQVNKFAAEDGARIVDVETYLVGGQRRFAVLLINNSNALTSRVGNLLRTGTDGAVGLYLKQVGGPVLAALQERRIFEPASTIKALILLHAMQQVQAGNAALTDQIVAYPDTSCPNGAPLGTTQTLQSALAGMMQVSNNSQTRAAADTFGFASINGTAQASGMTDTQINQTLIGCGTPPFNDLTLVDIGLLYEGVADGTLLNTTNRDVFFSLMAGQKMFQAQGFDFVGIWEDIRTIVAEEAPALLNAAQRQAFLDQMGENAKAGGYTTCPRTGPCSLVEYRSAGGWARIPFCQNSTVVPREYVFGFFIDEATNQSNANSTFGAVRAELLREQIRSALSGWGPCSTTPTATPTPTPTAGVTTDTPEPTDTPTPTDTPAPADTPTSTPTPTSEPSDASGDANGDGDVTSVDAAIVLQFVAGLLDSAGCPVCADANQDGDVTAIDATLILQFVAGLLSSLPP
ncbi:MAG: serine hydrolase [Chloroflexi bacterium]|nr:serine hydrolase [Chloroflexota bacterium]